MSDQAGDARFIVEEYAAALEEWMREHGASVMREQLHLDEASIECVFWRSGYLKALQDLQTLIRDLSPRDPPATQGISMMDH